MARILLGKEVTAAYDEWVAKSCAELKKRGVYPKLAILRCGERKEDLAYERGALKKAEAVGVDFELSVFPESVSADALMAKLRDLNEDPEVHGVLLFRPLPASLRAKENRILNTLRPEKDIDCMTNLSNAGVYAGKALGFPPCTAEAVLATLDHYGIELEGKRAVVIGRSLVIGKPVAMLLLGRNATVTICHTRTANIREITRQADLIVTAAGCRGSLDAGFVRPGQVVIDVSTNYDPDKNDGKGGITGDAVFDEVADIVEAITPVPRGIGAVTTSVMIGNVVEAAIRAYEAGTKAEAQFLRQQKRPGTGWGGA